MSSAISTEVPASGPRPPTRPSAYPDSRASRTRVICVKPWPGDGAFRCTPIARAATGPRHKVARTRTTDGGERDADRRGAEGRAREAQGGERGAQGTRREGRLHEGEREGSRVGVRARPLPGHALPGAVAEAPRRGGRHPQLHPRARGAAEEEGVTRRRHATRASTTTEYPTAGRDPGFAYEWRWSPRNATTSPGRSVHRSPATASWISPDSHARYSRAPGVCGTPVMRAPGGSSIRSISMPGIGSGRSLRISTLDRTSRAS